MPAFHEENFAAIEIAMCRREPESTALSSFSCAGPCCSPSHFSVSITRWSNDGEYGGYTHCFRVSQSSLSGSFISYSIIIQRISARRIPPIPTYSGLQDNSNTSATLPVTF